MIQTSLEMSLNMPMEALYVCTRDPIVCSHGIAFQCLENHRTRSFQYRPRLESTVARTKAFPC